MIDVSTNKPLHVSTDGNAGPYIVVPVEQLESLCALLEANDLPYSVDKYAISLNGHPEVTTVNLGVGVDAEKMQKLLDGAA